MLEHGALNRDARRRFGGRVGCDRTPMKVSSRINVEIVMVCRSSNHLAFLMSESGLCCDLSTATVRNIATTRVKVSPTGTSRRVETAHRSYREGIVERAY